jgi:uncharacterized low-complexity protein
VRSNKTKNRYWEVRGNKTKNRYGRCWAIKLRTGIGRCGAIKPRTGIGRCGAIKPRTGIGRCGVIKPRTGIGRCGPNTVLCKTCNVLLCVLEQPRVDNSNAGLTGSNWSNWLKTGPVYNVFKFDRRVCMYLHSYLPKLSQDRRIVCGTRCTPFGFVQPPFFIVFLSMSCPTPWSWFFIWQL